MTERPDVPRALVVDDDEDVRNVMEMTLSRIAHWDVISTDRGATALDLAREHVPDVILLDLMMPEMDGIETARRLLADERTRSIPIVLVTAKASVGTHPEPWVGLGIAGVVSKPFRPRELGDRISDLAGWEPAAQPA